MTRLNTSKILLIETQLVELYTCEISYACLKSSSCDNLLKLNWEIRGPSRANFPNDQGQLLLIFIYVKCFV